MRRGNPLDDRRDHLGRGDRELAQLLVGDVRALAEHVDQHQQVTDVGDQAGVAEGDAVPAMNSASPPAPVSGSGSSLPWSCASFTSFSSEPCRVRMSMATDTSPVTVLTKHPSAVSGPSS